MTRTAVPSLADRRSRPRTTPPADDGTRNAEVGIVVLAVDGDLEDVLARLAALDVRVLSTHSLAAAPGPVVAGPVVAESVVAESIVAGPVEPEPAELEPVARPVGPDAEPAGVLTAGELRMDLGGVEVTVAGQRIGLTHQEFLLLKAFLQHPGRVLSRAQLLAQAWGYVNDWGPGRTVDVHVRRVRSKLGGRGPRIVTVRGFGYRLEASGSGRPAVLPTAHSPRAAPQPCQCSSSTCTLTRARSRTG